MFTVGTAWLGVANRTEVAASATAARILEVFFIYKLLLSFFTTKSQLFETRIVFGSSPLSCQPLATAQFYEREGLALSFNAFHTGLFLLNQGDLYLLSKLLKSKILCRRISSSSQTTQLARFPPSPSPLSK